ncbi:hypothetical protein ACFQXA_16295 [Nocardiopsis composta]
MSDRGGRLLRDGDPAQVDEADAVLEGGQRGLGDADREQGLADAARPDEGHRARVPDDPEEVGDVPFAADGGGGQGQIMVGV